MKRIYVISLLWAVIGFSCTTVVFETPQPPKTQNLNSIPSEIQGNYAFVVLNEKEAIHITSEYFDGDEGKKYLSDSLVLRKMGDKYVINQRIDKDGDTKGKWSVFVLEPKGCGFMKATTFVISEDKYVETFKEAYQATLFGEGKEKQLLINVDKPANFEKLLNDTEATMGIVLEKLEQ